MSPNGFARCVCCHVDRVSVPLTLAQIEPKWLVEIAPHYYKAKDFDDGRAMQKNVPKGKGKSALVD